MATNIEIKARVHHPAHLRAKVETISDTPGQRIPQEDIFFHSPHGRLKLRILDEEHGQLIYYERPDSAGPMRSDYTISLTSDPRRLQDVLGRAYGVRGVVRKERWLYLVGNTRIHLDQVERLGSFLELEVVLSGGQSVEQGQAFATGLMDRLNVSETDLIEAAYIDLLEQEAAA